MPSKRQNDLYAVTAALKSIITEHIAKSGWVTEPEKVERLSLATDALCAALYQLVNYEWESIDREADRYRDDGP